jgi:signal transduction histidine kinase
MSEDGDTIVYDACWTDGRVAPLIGQVRAAKLGRHVRSIASRGMTLVYADLAQDPQVTDSDFAEIHARAGIGVPLVRDGRWNGSLYVTEPQPRCWSAEEVALVEEVAQLSWDAVARVEALAELRAHNRALAGKIEATEEQRHRQLAALREAEELSRLAMASVNGVGTWTYDIASDRLVVDAGFAQLYAIDPERGAAGVPMEEAMRHIHPDDGAIAAAKLASNRRVGFGSSEYRVLGPDGVTRWVLSRSHTIADDTGAAATALGVVLDITDQRALEEQLRQAQKMEAVGQLTGGLAHDFNNLLTGISGAMEMMQVRLRQGRYEALPAYIEAAQGAARRAAALTHRLLAFSRRQTLDPRPTDVNRLIGEIEELVRRSVGPGIVVAVEADPDLCPALIDANQLENALLNLCINARDAMSGSGTIRIATHNVTLAQGAAEELDVRPGDYLRLDIVDDGVGMSPQVTARAFDPFFTTKPMGEGTGLGLSMIYGFARQSGGQIAIHSVEGQGTTMSLYLPRHAGPVELVPAEAGGSAPRGGQGRTVLVVDDEAAVRMLVNDALSELDYTVLQAEDGAGAVAILTSDARIDLLVTDVGLPGGINGRQVADAARAARPALGVLFITGYAENAVIGNAPLDAGMELLTKPFTIAALGSRVADMVAR